MYHIVVFYLPFCICGPVSWQSQSPHICQCLLSVYLWLFTKLFVSYPPVESGLSFSICKAHGSDQICYPQHTLTWTVDLSLSSLSCLGCNHYTVFFKQEDWNMLISSRFSHHLPCLLFYLYTDWNQWICSAFPVSPLTLTLSPFSSLQRCQSPVLLSRWFLSDVPQGPVLCPLYCHFVMLILIDIT